MRIPLHALTTSSASVSARYIRSSAVYCAEVESVLADHPSVSQVAVFGVPNEVLGELVVAAVVQRQGAVVDHTQLAVWCRNRLSAYKVPYAFVFLEALPTTGSGKVLKRRLRELLLAGELQPSEAQSAPADNRFYTTAWSPQGNTSAASQVPLQWLLLGETVASTEQLRSELQSRSPGAQISAMPRAAVLAPSFPLELADQLSASEAPFAVVVLWPLECAVGYAPGCAAEVESAADSNMRSSLALIHALLASRETSRCLSVIFVSRGAVAVDEHDGPAARELAVSLAPMVGLLRVVKVEHPLLPLRLLDLPPLLASFQQSNVMADLASTLLSLLMCGPGDGALPFALRRGQMLVPRLLCTSAPAPTSRLAEGCGMAIFGGFGSVGLLHAAFLMQRMNIRTLALFGRGLSAEAETRLRRLGTARGCEVLAVQVDVAAEAEVELAFRLLSETSTCKAWGVLHLAGVSPDACVIDTTWELCRSALAPKLAGAIHVADCIRSVLPRIEFLVLGSSACAFRAMPRMYAVASADAVAGVLALQLRAHGVCALAFHWSAWGGASNVRDGFQYRPPDAGLESLMLVLSCVQHGRMPSQLVFLPQGAAERHADVLTSSSVVQACVRSVLEATEVLDCDEPLATMGMTSLRAVEAHAALQRALDLQLPATLLFDCPTIRDVIAFVDRLRDSHGAPTAERTRVRSAVVAAVARTLGASDLASIGVEDSDPLTSAGLSSVGAIAVHAELEKVLQQRLPATLLFDYPSVEALVQHLVHDAATAPVNALADALPAVQPSAGPVAVICGQASRTPCDFLSSLRIADGITSLPLLRWDIDAVLQGAQDARAARFGGVVVDADVFDAELFGITPSEAIAMDPQQRLALAVAHACLSSTDAGHSKERAVLVGISQVEYPSILRAAGLPLSAHSATGAHLSVAAGRISFTYGFKAGAYALWILRHVRACSDHGAIHSATLQLRCRLTPLARHLWSRHTSPTVC